jgi:TRAP-type mannitol/chloroaromatic compound transport system permease large subunit
MKLGPLFKAVVPFLMLDMVTIALVMIFPGLATWLPSFII